MIEIIGNELYQWDVGRSVKVTAVVATHVHFANKGDSMAPIMELAEGSANIPDYLLQTGKQLVVYAVANGVTIESKTFSVKKRERPENYVYKDDQRNYIYALIQSAEDATAEAARVAQELTTARANGEFNGPQGPKGDPGADGKDGSNGADGYSPVKGKDYFTDADKAEIVEDVLAEIPDPGNSDCSWKVVAETTLAENPEGASSLTWKFDNGDITTEAVKKMSEFRLLIQLPFTEDISANAFRFLVSFMDARTNEIYLLFSDYITTCTGGTPDAPKKLAITAHITKIKDVYEGIFRQVLKSDDKSSPKGCCVDVSNRTLLDSNRWGFQVMLKTYPIPVGTQVLLEGR